VDGGVLIGDAAHSFHQGNGAGAQQALADSLVLAEIIKSATEQMIFPRPHSPDTRRKENHLWDCFKGLAN